MISKETWESIGSWLILILCTIGAAEVCVKIFGEGLLAGWSCALLLLVVLWRLLEYEKSVRATRKDQ
jgi:hypothetical protein